MFLKYITQRLKIQSEDKRKPGSVQIDPGQKGDKPAAQTLPDATTGFYDRQPLS